MLNLLRQLVDANEKQIAQARKTLKLVNDLETDMQALSYTQMQERIREMQAVFKELTKEMPEEHKSSLVRVDRNSVPDYEKKIYGKLQEFMPEVYAMAREVMRREFNRRHYDVQIIASIILAQGQKLTELKTGEGKTQVFQLPLLLYSLVGRGAHLITVNDYLAKRDGEYAGYVANILGLSVGIINSGGTSYKFVDFDKIEAEKGEEAKKEAMAQWKRNLADLRGLNLKTVDKKTAYDCDITVGINNEFGFDYLRDNMASNVYDIVQNELYFCIVDEADSILIDEARTPLIISALPEKSDLDKYKTYAKVAAKLEEDVDFEIDHKTRTVVLTETGIEKAQKQLGVDNVWADYSAAHHLENALKAKALFLLDDHYIVQGGEVLIVDTFTGRVMPGRRFSEGIHQAIEAKEGVEIQQESKTMATITFQNFFRLYKYLAGGSGTIMTEGEEFYKIYALDSVAIPTNRPVVRDDKADVIYRDQETKYKALALEVKERHETGQPILIGTTSVEKSELVSRLLDKEGVPHEVLNAKYHEREAQIVAKAGEVGAVMVATNMAGRGTDIPLAKEVKELGGLAVLGTERHEARRIDNQLRGRSGRQGDPGYSRFYVALDDQIMRVLGGDLIDRMVGRFMNSDAPIELGLISRQIESAQKRIEGMNFDTRKNLVDYDDVMNKQREVYYARRRRILNLSDAASARSETAQESLQDLQQYVHERLQTEVERIVATYYGAEKTITDKESAKAFAASVLDLAVDKRLAKAFEVDVADLEKWLVKNSQKLESAEMQQKLSDAVKKVASEKLSEFGAELPNIFKAVVLEGMNRLWMEHLETMNDVRSGITLQSYAQRDPLVAYKQSGFQEFDQFMSKIDANLNRRILKVTRVSEQQMQQMQLQQQNLLTNDSQIADVLTGDRESTLEAFADQDPVSQSNLETLKRQQALAKKASVRKPIKKEEKIGRNDPCPCGSGKKYKQCGLLNTEEHKQKMAAK